jgi:hypothetical protein
MRPLSSRSFGTSLATDRFFRALSETREPKLMSAANYLEAAIVIDAAKSPIASRRFDDAVATAGIIIEPVDREPAEIARAAYRDFGKGRPPGGPELRRLFRLRARPRAARAAPIQGRRVFADGRRGRGMTRAVALMTSNTGSCRTSRKGGHRTNRRRLGPPAMRPFANLRVRSVNGTAPRGCST